MPRKKYPRHGYLSFHRGLDEPSEEDRLEIEARTKRILLRKMVQEPSYLATMDRTRMMSQAIDRCRTDGSHRRVKQVSSY